jgi:hypothetical protein
MIEMEVKEKKQQNRELLDEMDQVLNDLASWKKDRAVPRNEIKVEED